MSCSEQKTQRTRNFTMKVKGLKEKMSELYTSNCQKMKSWSENNEVVHDALRKFKRKKMEKKKKEETDNDGRRVSSMKEESMSSSKYSMLKKLSELDEKLEKTMERIEVLEAEFERELVRRCSTVKDEKQMSDSDDNDESESGYCTPDS